MGRLPVDEAPGAGDERDQVAPTRRRSPSTWKRARKFDVLKTREGYYRNWDHQLMQEMYTITFKPAAEIKDKWDLFTMSPPVPAANQSLEVIAPTREDNNCTMPA